MKHLPGSLKNLAKGFASDFGVAKGYFPHLFNTLANADYVGPIPDAKYFDISFVAKTVKDRNDFYEWYNAFEGEWNLKQELLKYCENDVEVLAVITREYHKNILVIAGFSPWGFSTAPACAHEFIKQNVFLNYDLGSLSDDVATREHQLNEIAKTSGWPCLNASEYYFARGALRGGRTEVRCAHYKLSQEQIDRGVRIRYQDIVSQYPYQQVAHKFPVGVPEVEVYDLEFKPCVPCSGKLYATGKGCSCPFNTTEDTFWKKPSELGDATKEYILEKAQTKGGFIYVDVTPPTNLYHPVLIAFDPVRKKAIAALERITGYFTMAEFVVALNHGYVINKVYRIDWYNMAEGLWSECVKKLYLQKMMFSKELPSPEEQEALIEEYEHYFGMGEIMRKSFTSGQWGKSDAKKLTAKIILNSGWGKHAQRPIFDQTVVADEQTDLFNLLENIAAENAEFVSINNMQHYTKITTKDNSYKTLPSLHDSYIPAAVYVSAYGRLQLWTELNKLDKRAVYHDTDSCFFLSDPDEYNIPVGNRLGQWEIEDDDIKNGGIIEFVSAGPKTYGFKTMNGKVFVKCKGVTLKNATNSIVNFNTLKFNVLQGLLGEKQKIDTPQMFFKYTPGKGMTSYNDYKQFGFDPDTAKGFFRGKYLYPFGYDESLIN